MPVGAEEEERGRRMLSRESRRGGRDSRGSWERSYVILQKDDCQR